ncbi:MAG: flagellar protein FliS [Actinobacteria bacterium]|nr:flagellar protein FliS [Actinomycetota bacterium]
MTTLATPHRAANADALRSRFTEGALDTASGPKVIQLCYERLDRDLDGALAAIDRRDISGAHEQLCHAQDIVHELLCMLDLDRWEHARTLASIYRYVLELLTDANVRKQPGPAREARHLLAELGEAFRAGAAAATVEPAAPSQFSARA